MSEILIFIFGVSAGFFAHAIPMKVSFKQKTIENKIKVYDTVIVEWVKMRNYIFSFHDGNSNSLMPESACVEFDQMYGQTQQCIGEVFLVCEDEALTSDINELNEKMYRLGWHRITIDEANFEMEKIKVEAFKLITRMRADIKSSTRLELSDFTHIFSGFFNAKDT